MRKMYQTKNNNCFATCVCCLLELNEIDLEKFPPSNIDNWSIEFRQYLRNNYDYDLLFVKHNSELNDVLTLPDSLCIITGDSLYTKNSYHSVIGRKGKIIFDPKEESKGLTGNPKDWEYCFLIKIFR